MIIVVMGMVAINSHLTAKMYKELTRIIEFIDDKTQTPLDRAREHKIEYRGNN